MVRGPSFSTPGERVQEGTPRAAEGDLVTQPTIKLTQDDIVEAIGFLLEAKGADADVGTIKFKMVRGRLSAVLEGQLAEEEDVDAAGVAPESESQHLSGAEVLELCVRLDQTSLCGAAARTTRETFDVFTNEEIPRGVDVLWIEGVGITRAPLERWWPDIRAKLKPAPDEEAAAAADILGDDEGGPLDRGEALGKALRDG
jgi:hypothetical protein